LSVRDKGQIAAATHPSDKSLGYSQVSLRDENHPRHGVRKAKVQLSLWHKRHVAATTQPSDESLDYCQMPLRRK